MALEEANGLVKIASGAALGMRAGASRDVMEVHRMLAHPSKDITRNTAVMMGIETTGQWGACETCFRAKAKRHAVPKKTDRRASVRTTKIVERQAVQWVDGPKTTGGDGTGSDDRGMKSAGDGTIVERGTPQLNVQELGQEHQLTLHDHETRQAFGTGSDDRGMKSAGNGTIIERGTPQLNVQELGQERQLTLHEHETQEAFGTGSDDRGMKFGGRWNLCRERDSAARCSGAGTFSEHMGDAGYYMGCHITKNRKARELKFDQHLYVVKIFDVEKKSKIPAASGVPTLLKADEARNSAEKEEMRKFPYREAVGAAHVDSDDDTAGYCVRRTRCGRVLRKSWAGA